MAAYTYEPEGRPDKNLLEQYIFSSCESSKVERADKIAAKQKRKKK